MPSDGIPHGWADAGKVSPTNCSLLRQSAAALSGAASRRGTERMDVAVCRLHYDQKITTPALNTVVERAVSVFGKASQGGYHSGRPSRLTRLQARNRRSTSPKPRLPLCGTNRLAPITSPALAFNVVRRSSHSEGRSLVRWSTTRQYQ